MNINWQDVFVAIGKGTGIAFAAAYLLKSVFKQLLSRDMERFKNNLQNTANAEAENLRHSLQKVALEHEVRFTSLHERRADMIADIYAQVVDAEQLGQRFAYVESYENPEVRREAYFENIRKLLELYYFIEKRRFYLPVHICELLKTFVDKVRKSVIGMNIFAPLDPSGPNYATLLERKLKMMEEVNTAFETSIPALRDALENEFRSILGAEG